MSVEPSGSEAEVSEIPEYAKDSVSLSIFLILSSVLEIIDLYNNVY